MESISLFLSSSLPLKPFTPPKPSHFPPLKSQPHLSLLPILLTPISLPFPSIASEQLLLPLTTDPSSIPSKINLEAIVVSIDDFFNTHPFFVYSVAFVWLIAIPLIQAELKKCKFISAEDAFLKLRDDPRAQLLDIRDAKSVKALRSPNLRILGKETAQVWFPKVDEEEQVDEEEEKGFVKRVLERFGEPLYTVVCILDNFDGNSMKAAQILYKNGFKETYAIEGGVLGNKGWKEIQEQYIPPSAHIYNKKKMKSIQRELNGAYQQSDDQVNGSTPVTSSEAEVAGSDTTYYADVEPPSPSPSKP